MHIKHGTYQRETSYIVREGSSGNMFMWHKPHIEDSPYASCYNLAQVISVCDIAFIKETPYVLCSKLAQVICICDIQYFSMRDLMKRGLS